MRGVLQQNLEQICDLEQQYFEGKMTRMNNLFVKWTNSLCPMLGFNGTKPWAICNLGQHFEGEATKNEQFISYEQNSWCSMWGWVKWDKTLSNLWSSLLLGWLDRPAASNHTGFNNYPPAEATLLHFPKCWTNTKQCRQASSSRQDEHNPHPPKYWFKVYLTRVKVSSNKKVLKAKIPLWLFPASWSPWLGFAAR
jgi:hypothetical protein